MRPQTADPTPTALIVDDDTTTRLLAREALEQCGLAVHEADDGGAGVHLFTEIRPDIVLMDVNMPGKDGFTACAELRRLPFGAVTPVLFMTGLDDEESIVRAYEAGATDFVTKPFNALILGQRVRYMLRASRVLQLLHASQERLAQAQRIARLGSWEWDCERQAMVGLSRECFRILGVTEEEFGGGSEDYLRLVHPDDRERVALAFAEAVRSKGCCVLDHRLIQPAGQHIIVQFQAAGSNRGEKREVLIGTIQDITAQKQVEQALADGARALEAKNEDLEAARDKAMEASRLKSEFLANVSHELLTPMHGLIGMASLLSDTELTAEQQEYVTEIQASGESLCRLIKGVLTISTIDSGETVLKEEKIAPDALLAEALASVQAQAEAKRLRLQRRVEGGVPSQLTGDRGRLIQILGHLIDNAVKFTNEGQIEVRLSLAERRAASSLYRFEIEDTGIGIPPEARGRLFELFTQVDGSSTRAQGGIGLGLITAKKLAGLLRGDIGVESTPGRGSLFWFTAELSN